MSEASEVERMTLDALYARQKPFIIDGVGDRKIESAVTLPAHYGKPS